MTRFDHYLNLFCRYAGITLVISGVALMTTVATAQTLQHRQCWNVYIPSFAHPCNCYKDPATMPPNDPHWSDFCRAALGNNPTDTSAPEPRCVDFQGFECFQTTGVLSCGDVWNCKGFKCNSWPAPRFSDCKLTGKGSCNRNFGRCSNPGNPVVTTP